MTCRAQLSWHFFVAVGEEQEKAKRPGNYWMSWKNGAMVSRSVGLSINDTQHKQ
jgi:hypothetical protein